MIGSTTIKTTREHGIGSNFTVLNPKDGYRKDDRLWFGTCNTCGEQVSNSHWTGVWVHSYSTKTEYGSTSVTTLDYCPKAS